MLGTVFDVDDVAILDEEEERLEAALDDGRGLGSAHH